MAAPRTPLLVAVAASGGRDSTALLHCVAHHAKAHGDMQVVALHVNHGLMPAADAWQTRVAAQVRRWARNGLPVRFVPTRLQTTPPRGRSIEEWARAERYLALSELARREGAALVLLAQHRDDQAETVLLQALRGAGPAGLAAMSEAFTRHGVEFARPWLQWPGSAIQRYVERFRLRFITDASNLDPRFDRSRLRAFVMPALATAFPQSGSSLQDVASRAQEADACLKELAGQDLADCVENGALVIEHWSRLSAPRRRNALRHWLNAMQEGLPTPQLIGRLTQELPGKRVGRWQCAAGTLACHAGKLRLVDTVLTVGPPALAEVRTNLERPGRYRFEGWNGTLEVAIVTGYGAAPELLKQVVVRQRSHGLQFQRAPGATPRSVKKEYQWAKVAAWLRHGPVLYAGAQLLFIAGLGLDARAKLAQGQQRGLHLVWHPDGSIHNP